VTRHPDVHVARGERGSGTLLAIGIIGCTVAALAAGVPLMVGLGIRQSVASAADAAALAGADVAAGLSPGSPCSIAADVAASNNSVLTACRVDGLVVTVRAHRGFLGLALVATATAGPPVVVTN
jgi:secretion/DNA translocation related TadE-like protein